jgi:hypothetical protein
LVSCGQKTTEVIDKSHYDYGDEYAEIHLYENSSKGRNTEYLFIHCTASREGLDLDLDWFLDFFKYDRGWSRPGYSFLVLLDGTIEVMWPNNLDGVTTLDEITNGAYGYNNRSIHIAYVGGVDRFLRPKDTRTPEQKTAIDKLVQSITCKIPNIQVLPHYAVNSGKACPSFNVEREYNYLNPTTNTKELFDLFTDSIHNYENIDL